MELLDLDILLIEDNPFDAELAIDALLRQDSDLKIKLLKDGSEALDFIFSKVHTTNKSPFLNPRLILLDLKLPKVNGLDVLKRLKSEKKTRDIPVVVLTSSREEKDIFTSYRNGVNSYIVKPVEFRAFSRTLAAVADYWMNLNEQPSPAGF